MSFDLRISVLIGTYNQAPKLNLVFDGFTRQTIPKDQFEIVVVDSSSTDDTPVICDTWAQDINLRYFKVENKGKAFARNFGAKHVLAPILFLTDADMIPAPDLLYEHIRAQSGADAAIYEGLTFNLAKEEMPLDNVEKTPYITRNLQSGQRTGFFHFLTGNLSLSTALFLQAGGFDQRFDGYGWEDIELGYRLVEQKKIPIFYLPEAVNYHYHVLSDDEDVRRCEAKGASATVLLKLHPELKLFLGLSPVLLRLFYWMDRARWEQGAWNWLRNQKGIKHRFAKWWLSELYYRRGARAVLQKQAG